MQYPASPETVQLCVRCVALVLVRATVAVHGPPSPHPESNRCPGHEERMLAHSSRIAKEIDNDHPDDSTTRPDASPGAPLEHRESGNGRLCAAPRPGSAGERRPLAATVVDGVEEAALGGRGAASAETP